MEISSIAVFGATDPVGERVLEAALTKGMKVRVLVSESEGAGLRRRPGLEVVVGDALDVADVKATLEGQQAAVVTVGASRPWQRPPECPGNNYFGGIRDYSESMKNIVAAMESLNIKFISASLPVEIQVEDRQKALLPLESSQLLWVIARASTLGITEQHPSGYIVRRTGFNPHYASTYTSAADLAQFLLDCLVMPEHYQKTVEVFSRSNKSL